MTLTTSPTLTADELFQLPGDDRRELVKGELRPIAPAGFDHGSIISNLHYVLADFVRRNNLGIVTGAETGFRLSRDPDTVRGPDIAFVAKGRIPAVRPVGYFEGAPDLAVEVLSPHDTVEMVEEKVDDYLEAGSAVVWVVNPRRRSVTIHRPDNQQQVLRENDTLSGEGPLAGFACRVAEIFA